MAWLVPFASLTPQQQDAVQLDTRTHKAIIGGPGAGKTLVLLHRFSLLFNRVGGNPDAIRLFVYTNTLKQFIRAGGELTDVPEECISTLDKWYSDAYQQYVSRTTPRVGGKPDYDAVRAGVATAISDGRIATPVFDCVLVDEAQDLEGDAIELLKRLARHVTVCLDGKQQIYDERVSESEALGRLGLGRHNIALLSAFRCNPLVTELAAQFIVDQQRRQEFMRQCANSEMDRSRPLLYVADNFEDERAHLIDMVRLRLGYGDSIAVLFPQQRQVHGFAHGLAEAGVNVEIQDWRSSIDFSTPSPKLMTYHQAKGLTLDSIFLPRLDESSFPGKLRERMRHLLFVGASRATKWVCLSGKNGTLIEPIVEFGRRGSVPFLETVLSEKANALLGGPQRESETPIADAFGLD